MSEFSNHAEYAVKKKYDGKYGRNRTLTILAYIIVPLIVLFILLALVGAGAFIWFVPLCPFFLGMIIPATYNRYFQIDYEYRVEGGDFVVTEIRNNKKRVTLCTFKVSSAEMIAPYCDEYRKNADEMSFGKVYVTVSSMKSNNIYFAIVPDENDSSVKNLVLFEPTDKILSRMFFLKKTTIVTKIGF